MIEHELGGMFDVAHGAGLAAIWGSWARYVVEEAPSRFAQFAVNVMNVPNQESDPKQTALHGISALEGYFREIQMPVNLHELGCRPADNQIATLADRCCDGDTHTVGHFRALTSADVERILLAAR